MNKIMNGIINILSNFVVRRILIIFFVGLVTRGVLNYVYDINVFKDYTSIVSLMYYMFMGFSLGYLVELPKINSNVFDIKLIRSEIKAMCQGISIFGNKMFTYSSGSANCGDSFSRKDLDKDSLVSKQKGSGERDRSVLSGGKSKRSVSAGVKGLYGTELSSREKSAGVKGLYDSIEDKKGYKSKNRTRDVSRVRRDTVVDDHVGTINELDGRSIYELGVKSRSSSVRSRGIHEIDGRSVTNTRQRYLPYRPEPLELDSRIIEGINRQPSTSYPWGPDSYQKSGENRQPSTSYPWGPDSYNKLGVNENHRSLNQTWDEKSYPRYYKGYDSISKRRPLLSDSTKLGEIYPMSDRDKRYYDEYNKNLYKTLKNNTVKEGKRAKIVGKIADWIIK